MAATATVAVAATVLASRVREVYADAEAAAEPGVPSDVEASAEATRLEAPPEPPREVSIAPEPIIRSTARRRTESIPGRRARRPHVPRRRRERPPGLFPVIVMLLVGVFLAVPWYLPGFDRTAQGWADDFIALYTPPKATVVADPPVLSSEPVDQTTSVAPVSRAGVPLTLAVPLLQVESRVVPISGNSGALLPPSDPQKIGWWMQGPKPGSSEGTAVLTGHTVHFGGGAFDHLSFLKVGNHFTITTDHGSIRYVIVHLHKYETGELSRKAATLFQLTGPPRVLLVTCSGWNGHIYLENTVVTGVPA